jgi:hypothetical protein
LREIRQIWKRKEVRERQGKGGRKEGEQKRVKL